MTIQRKSVPQVFSAVSEMREQIRKARRGAGCSIGLVPTMGYLHAGHLALAAKAREENDVVVVSIFVNPTQFGPQEDFARYPRDMQRDCALLGTVGVDVVFAPSVEEMYPPYFATYVHVEQVTGVLEGARRPGHFRGVSTVVTKLLNIVQPNRAYFGQKDAQQVVVIRRMVEDLNIDTEIVVMPIVREEDGLAMSSRNTYLSAEDRAVAPMLYRSLQAVQERWASGERAADVLRQTVQEMLAAEPLIELEYVSVADQQTLEELVFVDRPALVSLAARLGRTRLIDNILLQIE